MAVEVTITSAEVIPFYGTNNAIKEFKSDKGGSIISFNVKTRLNDRSDKSPFTYKKCTIFTKTSEVADNMKNIIQLGNIVTISGIEERSKYEKKDGTTGYSDSVNVKTIIPIVLNNDSQISQECTDDDLPF